MELVAVRHGITAWNLERRYQGQQDIPLLFPDAEDGLLALRDALVDEQFDAIYSSDLNRCQQTLAWAEVAKPIGSSMDTAATSTTVLTLCFIACFTPQNNNLAEATIFTILKHLSLLVQ